MRKMLEVQVLRVGTYLDLGGLELAGVLTRFPPR
jgi:hypothetical protein